MFTKEQIEFMKKNRLEMDFSHLADKDYIEIEERIGDIYTGLVEDSPQKVTDEILMCESILDQL